MSHSLSVDKPLRLTMCENHAERRILSDCRNHTREIHTAMVNMVQSVEFVRLSLNCLLLLSINTLFVVRVLRLSVVDPRGRKGTLVPLANFFSLPPANEVWGKVIFLHLSVILFTKGECLGRYNPQVGTPPRQVHPLATYTPWPGTLPGQVPPGQVHP